MVAGLWRVSWSVTEIAALAGKAARGAGAPPAQAARFGAVVAAHLANEKSAEDLMRALNALPSGEIVALPLALDAALASLATGGPAVLELVSNTSLLESYVGQLPFAAHVSETPDGRVCLHADLTKPRAATAPGRVSGCDDLVARMETLAERTFVPETEASRAAGAGAGLSDND